MAVHPLPSESVVNPDLDDDKIARPEHCAPDLDDCEWYSHWEEDFHSTQLWWTYHWNGCDTCRPRFRAYNRRLSGLCPDGRGLWDTLIRYETRAKRATARHQARFHAEEEE